MQPKTAGRPAKTARKLYGRKPGFTRFAIEMQVDLLTRVERAATAARRSRNSEILVLVEEALEAREKK